MQRTNRTEWPSLSQGDHSREQARRQGRVVPGREHGARAQATVPDEAPRIARYEDESTRTYVVRDPKAREVLVPKSREAAEPYPMERGRQPHSIRLLRWSAVALCAVVLGGLGGVIVGLPVVVVAASGLAGHERAIHRWRRAHAGPTGLPPVPAAATTELMRLRTAFWQGLVALVFGAALLLFITGHIL